MNNFIKEFNSLNWHDSDLLSIEIDRKNPGELDLIKLSIRWSSGEIEEISFENTYFLDISMNFGVLSSDNILFAMALNDSQQLSQIKSKWRSLGVDLADLVCYEIQTNTTNSLIKIYSTSFKIKPMNL